MAGERRSEATYSLGAVVRLTGLSPHVLRAWERRHGAVRPLRTAGGTRRYRESDVARLRLLQAAVEAGHPIGDVARLSEAELRRRLDAEARPRPLLKPILDAIERLDASEAERLLGLQLSALGPHRFASWVATPLLHDVGALWARGRLCIASEHLASALLRSLLGASLRRGPAAGGRPVMIFTTAPGERHELGVLVCAVVAAELGASSVYLGPDLPPGEVVDAARRLEASVVAVGTTDGRPAPERARALGELREALPAEIQLWVGGAGSEDVELGSGIQRIADLEALEQKVALLGVS
jgi:DNA-binding transcriptional MerR regulator/methylmalonyl-CoA mutase cobalamin-binding subunit